MKRLGLSMGTGEGQCGGFTGRSGKAWESKEGCGPGRAGGATAHKRADDRGADVSAREDPVVFLMMNEQLQCRNPLAIPPSTVHRAMWAAVRWGCCRTSLPISSFGALSNVAPTDKTVASPTDKTYREKVDPVTTENSSSQITGTTKR